MENNQLTPETVNLLNQFANFIGEKNKSVKQLSLSEFTNEILDYYKEQRSKSSYRVLNTSLKHLKSFIGDILLNAIDVKTLDRFFIYLLKKAPNGSYGYYRTLKAAFNKAVTWGYISLNPFVNIHLPKRQKPQPVIISDDELKIIISNISNRIIKDFVLFLLNTGMRISECLNLTWQDINYEKMTLQIGNLNFQTKTRQVRYIPISETVLKILKRNSPKILSIHSKQHYIFRKSNGLPFTVCYISKIFKSAVRAGNLNEQIHLYCTRSTYATKLINAGVSILKVSILLGHKNIATTQKNYIHLRISDLKEAVKVFDNYYT